MSEKPFRILGLQQIAIGGPSKKALLGLWVELFGLEVTGTFRSESENVDEEILRLGSGLTAIEVDVMEPINPDKAPKVHVPPLNHIGLWVDKLADCVKWLEGKGVRFTPGGIRKGAAGYDVCFIHPKGNEQSPIGGEGVLIELIQAPADVIAAFSGK
ncbi:MAG: VOC family protein [Leptospirales bacterium]|nr:VOC family protein [Leptospirales bacterium]